jgi:hypothetical protein
MLLVSATVGPFRSINKPQKLEVDPNITVIVGMNEAGKTVILQSLQKAGDALGLAAFDPVEDYPRKDLQQYLKRHATAPEDVIRLTYALSDAEIAEIRNTLHVEIPDGLTFTVTSRYDNSRIPDVSIDKGDEVWSWLEPRTPRFLYFGDYEVLPSKTNLADLAMRASNPALLNSDARGVLALLRMADIEVADFANPGGYEALRAKIEGVSINLTDQIMEFWKQNENLEVAVDIMPDPKDEPPYNQGPNLYLRIKNTRHRGISTPFRQRSRGFIWFFSFLVWFDSVKNQFADAENGPERPHILLLDEPGLSLHALAQSDFLKYIDSLGRKHQVLYSTHSPFMVNADRLHQVRMIEDRATVGTTISATLEGIDPRTVFPLQAALGWTVAQNLFMSEKNLLVETPADLILIKVMSDMMEAAGKTALDPDVVIVPAGGLDKVATFVALLGANKVKLAVLHDYTGTPDQRLAGLVRDKLIGQKFVFSAAQFRDLHNPGIAARPGDLEDLLPPDVYVQCFNRAYASQLGGEGIDRAKMPAGDRIVERIDRYLEWKRVSLRPGGGFSQYLIASEFARNPPSELDHDTQKRLDALFTAINAVY